MVHRDTALDMERKVVRPYSPIREHGDEPSRTKSRRLLRDVARVRSDVLTRGVYDRLKLAVGISEWGISAHQSQQGRLR